MTQAEIEELDSPPAFSEPDLRFYFALDDTEPTVISRVRDRKHPTIAIALLWYFKSKTILLNLCFKLMQADLSFISDLESTSQLKLMAEPMVLISDMAQRQT